MRILFEEFKYKLSDVEHVLFGMGYNANEDFVKIEHVGYFYNSLLQDCVFILPKVMLENIDGQQKVFGKYDPLKIINITNLKENSVLKSEEEREFIYGFAVWIYRAIVVYLEKKNCDTSIIYRTKKVDVGSGKRRLSNTYLDILLQLIEFNRRNKNFFFYVLKNIHSGLNKINWNRTISRTHAIIQDGTPVYHKPINKKKQINFDEELLVIFFSILKYITDKYGFKSEIICQYELITGRKFENYLKGYGKIRLRQIKYKYFSDKALELWNLCYAFFEQTKQIPMITGQREYLLAKDFDRVFEAIIDDLIGDNPLPDGLTKRQEDNKIIDHLFTSQSLIEENNEKDKTYYIGDSKYYTMNNKVGDPSVSKQYGYVKSVVQWCLDMFGKDKPTPSGVKLIDPVTEGYNIIPNFFISAKMDWGFDYGKDGIERTSTREQRHYREHFEDRIFDRDTLFIYHYDVNFLFVLALYARDNSSQKSTWKKRMRERFRTDMRAWLAEDYDFFAMKSRGNAIDGQQAIESNFKLLQGKLFRPYEDSEIYALSLKKHEGENNRESYIYNLLSEYFEIVDVKLGEDPTEELNRRIKAFQDANPYISVPKNILPHYFVEKYEEEYIVIGSYHDKDHWDWITGKNDKSSLIYNVRLDRTRAGFVPQARLRKMRPRFVILYEEGCQDTNKYNVFRVHDYAVMSEKRMREALYPDNHGGPKGNYFIFRFDDEISIGDINLSSLISDYKLLHSDYKYGAPIYLKCKELIPYRN